MNRLRIVVEETGPGVYEVVYVGRDAGKAQAALREPTANCRALFQYPKPSKYNRVVLPGTAPSAPIEVNAAVEEPAEEVPVVDDEAAELVGGATESPVEAEAAAPKARRKRK